MPPSSGIHTPLSNQVGGHPGVLTVADDSLIIKSTLPGEFNFYQTVLPTPQFDKLKYWVPKFVGTLQHSGETNETGDVVLNERPSSPEKEYIVLENVTSDFTKPNIVDVKLGTVLFDDSASPEKKERMEKTAASTTSGTTGIRVTGFQVFDSATFQTITTPKAYGKSIKPEELPEAFRKIFPVMSQSPSAEATTSEPQSTSSHNNPEIPVPSPDATPNPGLPATTLLRILLSIKTDVQTIRNTLKSIEMRMVGGSLLIVYEGHAQLADAIWEANGGEPGEGELDRIGRIGLEELEDYENDLSLDEDSDTSLEDDEGDASFETSLTTTTTSTDPTDQAGDVSVSSTSSLSSSSNLSSLSSLSSDAPTAPYVVRLIDFAHTKPTPGQGPDEGVLLGLNTVLNLLQGRIEEVRNLISEKDS